MTAIVATFAVQKGGVGKTTQLYNFSDYLVKYQNKKVLLIDFDYQGSLSEAFGIYDAKNTSLGIFTGDPVEIHEVNPLLSIIPASYELEDIPLRLRARGVQDVYFIVENWFYKNADRIESYDFILIDTHPDTLTVTLNAIATSHYQIGVIEPSEFSVNAIEKTSARLEELKRETFDFRHNENRVTSELLFIGNKLSKNEELTTDFIKNMSEKMIAMIPRKSLFDKSTYLQQSVFEQLSSYKIMNINGNKRFYEQLLIEYNKLFNYLNK
jgi:chromosome partitioning protein